MPATATVTASPRWYIALLAATRTDCPAFAPVTLLAQVRPQLTTALLPRWAVVRTLSMLTTPAMVTAAVPEKPRPMPKAAMSSLLDDVTATPRNVLEGST